VVNLAVVREDLVVLEVLGEPKVVLERKKSQERWQVK
jgi:hypothetical protein